MSDSTPSNTETVTPKRASSTAMIITLGGVAMLSGLLVVLTWQLTLGPINENKRIMIEKAIFQVLPKGTKKQSYIINENGLSTVVDAKGLAKDTLQFFAAYDDNNSLVGIAASSAAQGYADSVQLLYGYEPACQCIRGFSIIKMAETPGLGDKILTDKNFLASFDALDASLNSDHSALANNIVTVKNGTKKNAWEIDAISGATITSNAVGKAINIGAQKLIPAIDKVLGEIQSFPEQNTTIAASVETASKKD